MEQVIQVILFVIISLFFVAFSMWIAVLIIKSLFEEVQDQFTLNGFVVVYNRKGSFVNYVTILNHEKCLIKSKYCNVHKNELEGFILPYIKEIDYNKYNPTPLDEFDKVDIERGKQRIKKIQEEAKKNALRVGVGSLKLISKDGMAEVYGMRKARQVNINDLNH